MTDNTTTASSTGPCCGTATAATAAGACCDPVAKTEAVAAGASCCGTPAGTADSEPGESSAADGHEPPAAAGCCGGAAATVASTAAITPAPASPSEQAASPRELPVAVIGAGPVGLAAASHLHERGLPFVVLEAGDSIAASVRRWSHVRLFSPWRYNIDAAARRLLDAAGWTAPDDEALPTGGQLVEQYLQPLGKLPAIADNLRLGARVVAIARAGVDRVRSAGRENQPFVIRLADGTDLPAAAIIDAAGTWRTPNPLGVNGLPAHGEPDAADLIDHALPDVLGADRQAHAGRHTVVVGAGHSAANTLLDLAVLAETAPDTRITWAIRSASATRAYGGEQADQLPARGALGAGLRTLVDAGRVALVDGFGVHTVRRTTTSGVELVARDGRTLAADRVVAATGFRPDHSIADELRLDLDPILGCTRELADLIDPNEHSCGTVRPHGHRELAQPEPNYYAVGMKSYGRAPTFLLATGYEQARSVAAALAGDFTAADDIQLDLPETGVCSSNLNSDATAKDLADRHGIDPAIPARLAAATLPLLAAAASTEAAVRAAADQIGLDGDLAVRIAADATSTDTAGEGGLPSAAGLITLAPAASGGGGGCCG
ncbi:flavoprotein [Pilimelia terevasa]|uniref:Flavoprotein n=1 Tax=Pilimelia terevasa TaxID=53372 RepID=A0A8J3FJA8_9ACTN|nr:NAD(P)-binding domain-containing protein [Pilimelia terevasa]GGK22808.1 flavoprotein [Pilimelia terevasa]